MRHAIAVSVFVVLAEGASGAPTDGTLPRSSAPQHTSTFSILPLGPELDGLPPCLWWLSITEHGGIYYVYDHTRRVAYFALVYRAGSEVPKVRRTYENKELLLRSYDERTYRTSTTVFAVFRQVVPQEARQRFVDGAPTFSDLAQWFNDSANYLVFVHPKPLLKWFSTGVPQDLRTEIADEVMHLFIQRETELMESLRHAMPVGPSGSPDG